MPSKYRESETPLFFFRAVKQVYRKETAEGERKKKTLDNVGR